MKSKKLILLLVIIAAIAINTPAFSAGKKECGLVGSWIGAPDGPMVWTASHTPSDKDGNEGIMKMDWVYVAPSLLTWYNHYSVTRLTPGEGVWKKDKGKYFYTWYAFGIGTDGYPVYTLRVSGKAELTDCDTVSIAYAYELFNGPILPRDMLSENAAFGTAGEGIEYRNPLFMWPEYP